MTARLRRGIAALLAACATAALAVAPAAAAPAGPHIGVRSVQYDSPGAIVPAVVTVHGLPPGRRAEIWATGVGGATATCTGGVWVNPVRRTASRMCYLTLPGRAGTYNVLGAARLTDGTGTRTISGLGVRPVRADGLASPVPMTMAAVHEIERCHNTTGDVWLTFDDGGSGAQIGVILATLRRNDVKGHFFFRGDWARRNPALMRRIRAAGHVIGNHTATHPALNRTGRARTVREIAGGTAATGPVALLRPPFGAGAFTTRLQRHVASQGYRLCRWTTDTYDWEGPTAQRMAERITYGDDRSAPIAAGGNILMHGHGRHTAPGLQRIIDAVRAKGLRLQRLSG